MREILERHRGLLAGGLLVATCLITACDSDIIGDDFGPPSAYALVEGRVFRADETPGPAGMKVALTRCSLPVGGLAGSSTTVAGGHFSVEGAVPPVGFPEVDSLQIECELIAGQGFAESGVIEVSSSTVLSSRPL